MQDLHIPAIHAILSELHSALSTKSALFIMVYHWSVKYDLETFSYDQYFHGMYRHKQVFWHISLI